MTQGDEKIRVRITAGRGPAECALAARKLLERLSKAAARRGVKVEILETAPGRKPETYESVLLSLSGKKATAFIRPWIGTIRWICDSPYRPHHRRKNWYVGVDLATPRTTETIEVHPGDIEWKAVKSSGPGGQHVNTTDSAVQATHRPSGIKVTASEGRSQHANRKRAVEKIRAALSAQAEQEKAKAARRQWQANKGLERGNPVKTFTGKGFRER